MCTDKFSNQGRQARIRTESIGHAALHIPLFIEKSTRGCKGAGLQQTLARGVNHLHQTHLIIYNKQFPVGIFYSWIITLDNRLEILDQMRFNSLPLWGKKYNVGRVAVSTWQHAGRHKHTNKAVKSELGQVISTLLHL